MSLPTPFLGVSLSLYNVAEGTRIQVGTPEKQILEEVVKLYISFLSFMNGDWEEWKLFQEHSVLFFLVVS